MFSPRVTYVDNIEIAAICPPSRPVRHREKAGTKTLHSAPQVCSSTYIDYTPLHAISKHGTQTPPSCPQAPPSAPTPASAPLPRLRRRSSRSSASSLKLASSDNPLLLLLFFPGSSSPSQGAVDPPSGATATEPLASGVGATGSFCCGTGAPCLLLVGGRLYLSTCRAAT